MVRMKAPAGATGVAFQGVEHPVVDGFVEVPDEAVAELSAHGYRRAAPIDAAAAKDLVAGMDRAALLAFLRERGVAVEHPVSNAKLRDGARAEILTQKAG
jgi:hypothetical protein